MQTPVRAVHRLPAPRPLPLRRAEALAPGQCIEMPAEGLLPPQYLRAARRNSSAVAQRLGVARVKIHRRMTRRSPREPERL